MQVFGIIALAVILLFVVLLFTGGHGPGRHTFGDPDHRTPALSVTENAVQQS